tara:strand:- start:168055 stop:168894 length:840 start_codon:yes stop_codon:yes gene_type:complete
VESGLYVVATPIGNLGDLSARAVSVLQQADIIAAEDTRHSQRLLQHYAISTPLMAYHDHSDNRAVNKISTCLASGGSVALVSDAGTPLISDPGYRLVRAMQDQGFMVVPVPGACAAVAALSASGLATDRFLFEGFLPSRAGARENRLAELTHETATLIFYEAPHRVVACLEAMIDAFGAGREAVLAREVTKTFETIRRSTLADLRDFVAGDSNQQKGEMVLLVAGSRADNTEVTAEIAGLLLRLAQELPAKTAAAVVADYTGLRKKLLYNFLLERKSLL